MDEDGEGRKRQSPEQSERGSKRASERAERRHFHHPISVAAGDGGAGAGAREEARDCSSAARR